jgi:hypothetical protein
MFNPLCAGQPGPQGSLRLPVASLYHAIALWMVGCAVVVMGRRELTALVRRAGGRGPYLATQVEMKVSIHF